MIIFTLKRPFGQRPRVLAASLLAIFIAVTAGTEAFAARYKTLKIGGWKGGIYIDDRTGKFSHCVVSARYKSGITLLFSVTRGLRWKLGFSKPSWSLENGKTYPVFYQVDKGRVFKGDAKTSGKSLAVVSLPGSNSLFHEMRRGRTLRVKAGKDVLAFNLTGTNKMLATLLDCAKRNQNLKVSLSASNSVSQSGKGENPFETDKSSSSGKTATEPTIDVSQLRAEANRWFDTILAARGGPYSVIANEGKAAKLYERHNIVWRVGSKTGIFGTLRVLPRSKKDRLESSVLANDAKRCKGAFGSRFFDDDGVGSKEITRILTTCRKPDGKLFNAYYAIEPREAGGSRLVTVMSTRADADAVSFEGEKITGLMQSGEEQPQAVNDDDGDETDLPDLDEETVKRF